MPENNYCETCGIFDDYYNENPNINHAATAKHQFNLILRNYKANKSSFTSNRDGINVFGIVESEPLADNPGEVKEKTHHAKIRIYAKPNQKVKFTFEVSSDMRKEDVLVVGIQLGHPQPQFSMNDHPYKFGEEPHVLGTKCSLKDEISVAFKAADMGQYEMPIMFTFYRPYDKKNIIIVRDMVINVQDNPSISKFVKSPFTKENIGKAQYFVPSTNSSPHEVSYKIPKLLKTLLPRGLNEDAIDALRCSEDMKMQLREVLVATRAIFDEGITEDNYIMYFHYLLWWEEIICRINLRKYNMSKVTIEKYSSGEYWLEVPGLSEKRPSLLRGDRVYLFPITEQTTESKYPEISFESIIGNINENGINLTKMDETFEDYYSPTTLFNVRFLTCRVPMERMHGAVQRVFSSNQALRIFPKPNRIRPKLHHEIRKFYNTLIRDNEEQRSAVHHIVSNTSGLAPYIVFGPPGTGKTMTLVEAIIQIVVKNPKNRVLVCTDSNMAADHIALMLLRYNTDLNINNFILRANSRNREWTIMPPELIPVSNGSKFENFYPVTNDYAANYRILVTTLLHSAKYTPRDRSHSKLHITHLFIDEAAQALEPAALVPISNLLIPGGQLVLAGDPKQLGPVCISKEASERGLGTSLLERLWKTYKNLYDDDPNYITVLVQNFRSDPDILKIPNELFYTEKPLQPKAAPDPLSRISILGTPGGEKALVFHSVNSREMRMGNAPSFFNETELMMLQRYVKALTTEHAVETKDIGIIAPYIRQVYKMRDWLKNNNFDDVEIGTVESYQGKEKRVILVSTVRANCRLLDHDAKYGLGFMVDDKRFNVALTRAKAKLIIIGNSACLIRDFKWRKYMDVCKDFGTYFGGESEQWERTSTLLREVSTVRFNRCYLTEALELAMKNRGNGKEKKNKK